MKRGITCIAVLLLAGTAFSQSYIQPNYGLKSHETLKINKIEANSRGTTFYLSIENQIQDGSFCADENVFMICPDGSRSRLVYATGIPVCPGTHKFKAPGEKLDFELLFPPLKEGILWVDLVEECNADCFSFYGITLDNALNNKINESIALAESGESSKAIISLIDLLGSIDSKNEGIEGFLYLTIVKLAHEAGTRSVAGEWYRKMKSSGAPRLQLYLKNLESQGIKY